MIIRWIADLITSLRVWIDESRRGGIDGTDTWTGGEHK